MLWRDKSILSLSLLCLAVGSAWAQGRPAAYSTKPPRITVQPATPADAAAASPAEATPSEADPLRKRLAEKLNTDPPKPPKARAGTAAVRAATKSPPKPAVHWSYAGEGAPERWAQLKPEYRLCGSGTRQSPIDLRDGFRVDLEPIQFDYRPSAFAVIDNGHTVQVNVDPGNFLQVMGRRYELQQFHFHRPSEERLMGRQFEMSAHLVHKDADGRLAIVAVLLERGIEQPLVQLVWNNLPLEKNEALRAQASMDLRELLPADRGYFTYMGSLTTPPCSEGVLWMVMRQPVPVSPEQVGIFSRLYPVNARPLQSSGGRMIKESR